MITIVCPVWRRSVYEKVARPWIVDQAVNHGAQVIDVGGYESIFEAYQAGRKRAAFDVIVYVHDDVRLIEPFDLAPALVAAFKERKRLGLIGPCGRGVKPVRVPWWRNDGEFVGHYQSIRNGRLFYRYGSCGKMKDAASLPNDRWNKWAKVALVDGFFLAEHKRRLNLDWDTETFKGQWHGYDADRCMQAHSLGLDVMVSPWLFAHENGGHAGYKGTDPADDERTDDKGRIARNKGDALWLQDLDDVNSDLGRKWNIKCAY